MSQKKYQSGFTTYDNTVNMNPKALKGSSTDIFLNAAEAIPVPHFLFLYVHMQIEYSF